MKNFINKRTDFIWGMNVHARGYEAYPEANIEEHIRLCAELGTKMVRFNVNPLSSSEHAYVDKALLLCEKYGMEMMMCLDGLSMYNTQDEYEEYHSSLAKRYKGRIKYYQLFNEMDVYCMHLSNGEVCTGGDGDTIDQYNIERLQEVTPKLLGSIKGFRKSDPDAKLVVNFAWLHTAIIDYFMDNGAKWDIIGWDWYSDMEKASSITNIFDYLLDRYPSYDIIICECNIWACNKYTEEEQSEFMIELINKVYNYNSTKIKGMIFYELLDELAFERLKEYEGEAHFGFVKCDSSGVVNEPKKAYYTIQNILNS